MLDTSRSWYALSYSTDEACIQDIFAGPVVAPAPSENSYGNSEGVGLRLAVEDAKTHRFPHSSSRPCCYKNAVIMTSEYRCINVRCNTLFST